MPQHRGPCSTSAATLNGSAGYIVTGGGLAPSGDAWLPLGRRYLFPVKVMGPLFRGKFLDGLRLLHQQGRLRFAGRAAKLSDPAAFARLLDKLYCTDWNVYAKRPFAGTEKVFRYLGRYTHRVALSNQRIQFIDEHGVRFATKGGRSVTLPHQVFIARFLDHVLPSGFTKMRHFGLYASGNVNTKLEQARALLGRTAPHSPDDASQVQPLPWNEIVLKLTGIDPMLCPRCGSRLLRYRVPRPPRPLARNFPQPEPQDTS